MYRDHALAWQRVVLLEQLLPTPPLPEFGVTTPDTYAAPAHIARRRKTFAYNNSG
jgi:hypothetical protein